MVLVYRMFRRMAIFIFVREGDFFLRVLRVVVTSFVIFAVPVSDTIYEFICGLMWQKIESNHIKFNFISNDLF